MASNDVAVPFLQTLGGHVNVDHCRTTVTTTAATAIFNMLIFSRVTRTPS